MKVICHMGYTGCSNINDICEHGCICTAVNTQPLPDTPPIHSAGEIRKKETRQELWKRGYDLGFEEGHKEGYDRGIELLELYKKQNQKP